MLHTINTLNIRIEVTLMNNKYFPIPEFGYDCKKINRFILHN